ncbi:MAG: hypothetical protein EOM21_19025 [Gammaproteobacteria bacterium]|nr:hypothetical protein [Gammaproteobacteria bacterium]
MIPKQLRNLTFCKVLPKSKRAFEDSWQMHQLKYDDIIDWVKSGNNYGVICSRSNGVGIIDADCLSYVNDVEDLLPETFSVRSSSDSKRHFFYKLKNFPEHVNKIILCDPDTPDDKNKQGGDIRMGEFYVVGPGSIHPDTNEKYRVFNDVEIAELDFNLIVDIFGSCFRTNIIKNIKVNHRYKLPITKVIEHYGLTMKQASKNELFCAHPIHGSENGTNFGINIDKNVWICRRHNHGGNVFDLIAMLEGFIKCGNEEQLSNENKQKVNDIIQKNFGIDMNVYWDITKDKNLRGTYNNCLNFLDEKNYNIKFNEHSGCFDFNGARYDDLHILQVKKEMREIKLEPSLGIIDEAIKTYGIDKTYHPIKDYLNSLKWDGVNRVSHWLTGLCGADNCEYSSFVSRTILTAAVKRVFEPGCQFDHMPILEGSQGTGKSSLVRILGGDWYKSISLTDRDHNTIQKMQGAWFIEVAELAVFAKRDIESLKDFISTPVDATRFVYNRNDRFIPRQSIFIGTINPGVGGYLMDETGNRRFFPIKLGKINLDLINKNRNQLFAEAVQLYRSSIPIYIDNDKLMELATKQQKQREEHDEWADIIYSGLNQLKIDIGSEIRSVDVYQKIIKGDVDNYDKKTSLRIGKILRKMSGELPEQKKINGIVGKYFSVDKILEGYHNGFEVEKSNQM